MEKSIDNTNRTGEKDGKSSLSLLLEAAGEPQGAPGQAKGEMKDVSQLVDDRSTPVGTDLGGCEVASGSNKAMATGEKVIAANAIASSREKEADSINYSLDVLASAAQGNGDSNPEESQPGAASTTEEAKREVASIVSDVIQSRTESKKQRAALLKAVKSLSNDPLVQLSMLRAMQQQQVSPDVVRKNKEEREKAAEARHHKKLKRRKATEPPASVPPPKSQKIRIEERHYKQPEAGGASISSVPAPMAQGSAASQQMPAHTQLAGNALEALLISSNQLDNSSLFAAHTNPPADSDVNVLNGTLSFLQTLIDVIQQNQTQHPVASYPSLQSGGPADTTVTILDFIRSLGKGMPLQQQVAFAQVLLPGLSGAMNANCTGSGHAVSQSNGTSEPGSSLGSSLKDSQKSENDKSQSSPGQQVRIPCRARGMPSDHNFQSAHFILPKEIKHGQDLVCSYPTCRDGGIKFRYCLLCRIPVAKRNFRLRHSHVDTASQPPGPNEMKIPSTICVATDTARNSDLVGTRAAATRTHANNLYFQDNDDEAKDHGRAEKHRHEDRHHRHRKESNKRRHQNSLDAAVDEAAEKKGHDSDRDKKKRKKKHSPTRQSLSARKAADALTQQDNGGINYFDDRSHQPKRPPNDSSKRDALKNVGEKRLYMWASLLGQRPNRDDEDTMSKWLMNVLAVSDPKAPLKDDMSSSPFSLSLERFDGSDQNSRAKDWLAEAIHQN